MGELTPFLPTVFDEPLRTEILQPQSVAQFIRDMGVPEELYEHVYITVNSIPANDWDHTFLCEGDHVTFAIIPASDSTKTILATIAIIVIGIYAGPIATSVFGQTIGTFGYYATTAAITLAGTMLISALIPPPDLGDPRVLGGSFVNGKPENPSFRFTGQSNEARPYQTVPRIYGQIRFYPFLASTPLVENVGKTSKISAVYDFGIGDIDVADIRIGDLDAGVIDPNVVIHRNSYCDDLKIVTKSVSYAELAYELLQGDLLQLTTDLDTKRATLEIYFPRGLGRQSPDGQISKHSVAFRVRWRVANSSNAWTAVPHTAYKGATVGEVNWFWFSKYEIEDKDTKAVWLEFTKLRDGNQIYFVQIFNNGGKIFAWSGTKPYNGIQVTVNEKPFRKGALQLTDDQNPEDPEAVYSYFELLVPTIDPEDSVTVSASTLVPFTLSIQMAFITKGMYDVEIVRKSAAAPSEDVRSSLSDQTIATLFKSHQDGAVLNLAKRHTMMEFEYTANDQVSGILSNISGLARASIRSCTSTGWGSKTLTSNPAYIVLDILAGEANRRPLKDSQIDFARFRHLAGICNEVVTQTVNGKTYSSKRFEWNGVIDSDITVAAACQAILSTCRAQLTINGAGQVSVLIDEEQTVYRQLITPENSWEFSGQRVFPVLPDAFRVTFADEDSDWRSQDVMVYRDGYHVNNAKIIEDLTTWGITSFPEAYRYGRYMMAQGMMRNETFTVMMDVENLAMQRGDLVAIQHDVPKLGGMAFRIVAISGNVITVNRPIELFSGAYTVRLSNGSIRKGSVLNQVDNERFTLDNTSGMAIDNLIAMGESDPVTREYLVTAITPGDDLTARISLVAYVPEVYTADTGPLPEWDPGFGVGLRNTSAVVAEITGITTAWITKDRLPVMQVKMSWKISVGRSAYAGSSIFVKANNETFLLEEDVKEGTSTFIHEIGYNDLKFFSKPINYRVQPFNRLGANGTADSLTVSLPGYTGVPLPPTNVHLDMSPVTTTVMWTASVTQDVRYYRLRFTPELDAPKWNMGQPLADVSWNQTKSTHPARIGTYMICSVNAVDKSSEPVFVRTTTLAYSDSILLAEDHQETAWAGSKTNWTAGYAPAEIYANVRLLNTTVIHATAPFVSNFLVRKLDSSYVDVGTSASIPSSFLVSIVPTEFMHGNTVDPAGVWADNMPFPSDGAESIYVPAEPIVCIYEFDSVFDAGLITESRMAFYATFGAIDPANPGAPGTYGSIGWQRNARADEEYEPNYVYDKTNAWEFYAEYCVSADMEVWSEWRQFIATDVTTRYMRFRLVGIIYAARVALVVSSAYVNVVLVQRREIMTGLAIAAGGTAIVWARGAFVQKPMVSVTWPETQPTVTNYKLTSITRTGATLQLLNSAGVGVAGTADILATGYGLQRGSVI